MALTIVQNKIGGIVTSLTITSDLFANFGSFVDNKITITVKYNCNKDNSYSRTITSVSGGAYLITPLFLSLTTFQDGIYQIIVEGVTTVSTIKEEKCSFIDNETKCKVSELVALGNIEAGILYYTLGQAETCECVCENLCTIFCQLNEKLTNECNC